MVDPWLTLLAGGLAVFSAGAGFALGLAAIILSAINVLMLSPTLWLAAVAGKSFGTFLVIAQIVAARLGF